MRNRTLNPLFLSLCFSIGIHGGIIWLSSAWRRPVPFDTDRTALVNLLPASSRKEIFAGSPEAPTPDPAAVKTPAPDTPPGKPEQRHSFQAAPPSLAGTNLREDALARYITTIRSLIDRHKEYPYQARRQEQEGTVLIRFTLSRQGYLLGEPVIEKKSRWRLLDESAVLAVKKAAPYPPFPAEAGEDAISFQVVVSFSLQ
ncbi:MAG: energy transducer TonB [Spirochaetaceae bacterium]|jgi:TonB family protein|nr:energy transducer TonB [Spirochaetaceae bacterium]